MVLMIWNWQRPEWPHFTYDAAVIRAAEEQFLHSSGLVAGAFLHLNQDEGETIRVSLLSDEALETSKIEGELLNRDSLQSSVRRHFGLSMDPARVAASPAEQGVAEVLVDGYRNFDGDLTRERLEGWHGLLMQGRHDLKEKGRYRTGGDPMQIVSGPLHAPKVHFEAPPAAAVADEMERFLRWFHESREALPALARSALAHLYFESIHPFEDGNGRIGRAIAELSLSQSLGKPVLLALSRTIGRHKKRYYDHLAEGSRSLEVTGWVRFFAPLVLEAQEQAGKQIGFILAKAKFFDRFRDRINPRQEKVLLRIFEEGPKGFTGGLSAGNYSRIAGSSPATTTRDLAELVEMGALHRTGERRHTRYYPSLPSPPPHPA